jgi:hypothetical protein
MDNTKIPLDPPFDFSKTVKIASYEYRITDLELFKYVNVLILIYDEAGAYYSNINYKIEGEEYTAWSNDDTYILDLIVAKIHSVYGSI